MPESYLQRALDDLEIADTANSTAEDHTRDGERDIGNIIALLAIAKATSALAWAVIEIAEQGRANRSTDA